MHLDSIANKLVLVCVISWQAHYGMQVAAAIIDILGHSYTYRLFLHVQSLTPIYFLLGIFDQRRTAFDFCISEKRATDFSIYH